MAWTLSAFADEAGPEIETQIAACRTTGLDHVDLRKVGEHNIVDLPVERAREVKGKLDEAGIRVSMFGSPIGKIDVEDDFGIDLARLEHLAELKDVFDCRAVRMFSYHNKKGDHNEGAWRERCLERLHRLHELAERLDMVLYHENEMGIYGQSVAHVAEIRDALRAGDSPHFRMIFDFANYEHAGEDCREAWQQLGETTDGIHLKECRFRDDGGDDHVPVGSGDGYVSEILADLAAREWEGPLTVEPHLKGSKAAWPPSGGGTPLNEMPPAESFAIAVQAARTELKKVGRLP